jgi:hypothetical protein
VGKGEIWIDLQGFPVMADCVVDPTTAGIDFTELKCAGANSGSARTASWYS